ncbi:hypothetical protein HU200_048134 [Digitaria exilis]|uniref:Serine carboxypeptidase n=1 Tax=Digitaria exilis TaxID=1010633 RepID=A0A835AVN1_9POAL|nr:hypothetical protein HU200_048134 [Digitaria exilis]
MASKHIVSGMDAPRRRPSLPLHLLACITLLLLPPLTGAATVVRRLPGYHGALPFYLETGYVTVEETTGTELLPLPPNPRTDPLLLWLTGGPRCSVFSALAYEIGS